MKSSYKYNNDYYQNNSRDFNASTTRSMAQRKNYLSSSKVSDQNKSHRIEKACPTNSVEAYKKQVTLLKKQLERLEKDNLRKDHRIFQMEANYTMYRQLQSQLQETYRIIYMYEGKIQQLQKQLRRLQQRVADKVDSNFTAQQIQSLLNDYQNDNIQLRSSIEGQNRIIMELEQRLKTIQSKYFHTSWKLSSQNRVLANPLKKMFPKLRDTIVIQQMSLSQRQKMMNELQNKYNNLAQEKLVQQREQSKQNIKSNKSRNSKDKASFRNIGSQQNSLKKSRFSNSWQAPLSLRKVSEPQGATQNYKVEKIQSSSKINSKQFIQEWQPKKLQNRIGYELQVSNQNKKSQLSMMAENPSVSLNYSLSQGPFISSQKSINVQNGQTNSYRLSSSKIGQELNSAGTQNNSSSQYSIAQEGQKGKRTSGIYVINSVSQANNTNSQYSIAHGGEKVKRISGMSGANVASNFASSENNRNSQFSIARELEKGGKRISEVSGVRMVSNSIDSQNNVNSQFSIARRGQGTSQRVSGASDVQIVSNSNNEQNNRNSQFSIAQQNISGSKQRISSNSRVISNDQPQILQQSKQRIASNSRVISNDQSSRHVSRSTIYDGNQSIHKSRVSENKQGPQSPSSRIIRLSRSKVETVEHNQAQQPVTTYYQGSSSKGVGDPTEASKVKYVMRQAS